MPLDELMRYLEEGAGFTVSFIMENIVDDTVILDETNETIEELYDIIQEEEDAWES